MSSDFLDRLETFMRSTFEVLRHRRSLDSYLAEPEADVLAAVDVELEHRLTLLLEVLAEALGIGVQTTKPKLAEKTTRKRPESTNIKRS